MMTGYRIGPSRLALFAVFFMAAFAGFHGTAEAKRSSSAAGAARTVLISCPATNVSGGGQLYLEGIQEGGFAPEETILPFRTTCAQALSDIISAGLTMKSATLGEPNIPDEQLVTFVLLARGALAAQPTDVAILQCTKLRFYGSRASYFEGSTGVTPPTAEPCAHALVQLMDVGFDLTATIGTAPHGEFGNYSELTYVLQRPRP